MLERLRWSTVTSASLLLLFVIACTGINSPPNSPPTDDTNLSPTDVAAKKVYDRYYPALVASIDIYVFTNDLVRIAHESGAITDDQARELTPKLRAAKVALETARSTAVAYLKALKAGEAIGAGDTDTFTRNFLLAQAAVNVLLQLAQELGVI